MLRYFSFFLLLLILGTISCSEGLDNQKLKPDYVLVIHGGAGSILKENFSEEKEVAYRQKLNEALEAGSDILHNGGSSVEAVEQVIKILENSPLFNAGKGAVFNALGQNTMDAAIMDGKSLNAGAVAGVRKIKNPITAAKAVMEQSRHVFLIGEGADAFASDIGLEMVDTSYFFDQKRWDAYQKMKSDDKHGTVGCVALDKQGNLAAGTSTGGMTLKAPGRVGDSPVIGAGTYANNNSCAVSATGHGEYYIRNVVCHDISALMEYKGLSLGEATTYVIHNKLEKQKAGGGVIAVDYEGNIAMEFNTKGMFRGYLIAGEKPRVFLYGEDE